MNAPNTFVRAFLHKHLCMKRTASCGRLSVDERLKPMSFGYYNGEWPRCESSFYPRGSEGRYLFIATQVFDALVHGIVISIDKERQVVELFPIQVASTLETLCVDELFYRKKWRKMSEKIASFTYLKNYTLRSTFVFLCNGEASGEPDRVQKNVLEMTGSWATLYADLVRHCLVASHS